MFYCKSDSIHIVSYINRRFCDAICIWTSLTPHRCSAQIMQQTKVYVIQRVIRRNPTVDTFRRHGRQLAYKHSFVSTTSQLYKHSTKTAITTPTHYTLLIPLCGARRQQHRLSKHQANEKASHNCIAEPQLSLSGGSYGVKQRRVRHRRHGVQYITI